MVLRKRSAALATLLLGVCANDARAYCRTTTVDQQASSCPDTCTQNKGVPLAWSMSNVEIVLNRNGFPDMDDATLRQAVRTAYGAWTKVSCAGAPMGMTVDLASGTTDLTVGPKGMEPNDNVVVHFTKDEWAARGLAPQAFALTALWYEADCGQILGADMHFNGAMDPFVVCNERGCAGGETDFLNVATHEAGHFFGLGHSDVPESTMWCDASAEETQKRSLARDDIDGICDIYGPDADFTGKCGGVDPAKKTRGGCSVARAEERGAAYSGFLLAALSLLVVARRRRAR